MEDNSTRTNLDTDGIYKDTSEESASVNITNVKTRKINKSTIRPLATRNVEEEGSEKMRTINLPIIRHRRQKRLAREKKAIRDSCCFHPSWHPAGYA